jgi:hypothetical protein
VSRGRVAAVDGWQAQRVGPVAAEASRRREEHRLAAAAAAAPTHGRGESLGAIAALAQTTENDVRAHLKLAGAQGAAGGAEPPAAGAVGGGAGGGSAPEVVGGGA